MDKCLIREIAKNGEYGKMGNLWIGIVNHVVEIDSLDMINLEESYCWDCWLIIRNIINVYDNEILSGD